MEQTPTEHAVSAQDLADELRVSLDTIYRLANDGSIPGFRVGRQWRFYPAKVREHMAKPRDRWAQPARSRARRRAA